MSLENIVAKRDVNQILSQTVNVIAGTSRQLRAQVETAARLGYVVAAVREHRRAVVAARDLLMLLPLEHGSRDRVIEMLEERGEATKSYIETLLRTQLDLAVALAFSVGFSSQFLWKGAVPLELQQQVQATLVAEAPPAFAALLKKYLEVVGRGRQENVMDALERFSIELSESAVTLVIDTSGDT